MHPSHLFPIFIINFLYALLMIRCDRIYFHTGLGFKSYAILTFFTVEPVTWNRLAIYVLVYPASIASAIFSCLSIIKPVILLLPQSFLIFINVGSFSGVSEIDPYLASHMCNKCITSCHC